MSLRPLRPIDGSKVEAASVGGLFRPTILTLTPRRCIRREIADDEHRPQQLGFRQHALRNDFRSPPASCPNYEGFVIICIFGCSNLLCMDSIGRSR